MKQQFFNVRYLKLLSGKGFSLLSGVNRKVIPSNVSKLAESISKMGVIRPVVVANFTYNGVKDYYILDGQNLYHALIRLEMDIPYVEVSVNSNAELVETIALLNTSSKTWTLTDYINAWSFIKPDYKKLSELFEIYDIELSAIASVLHGYNGHSGANITKVIKNGTFQIKDLDSAVQKLQYTTDVLKIVPRLDRNSNRAFVASYLKFISSNDKYNHKRFQAYLKANLEKLELVNADGNVFMEFFSKA